MKASPEQSITPVDLHQSNLSRSREHRLQAMTCYYARHQLFHLVYTSSHGPTTIDFCLHLPLRNRVRTTDCDTGGDKRDKNEDPFPCLDTDPIQCCRYSGGITTIPRLLGQALMKNGVSRDILQSDFLGRGILSTGPPFIHKLLALFISVGVWGPQPMCPRSRRTTTGTAGSGSLS